MADLVSRAEAIAEIENYIEEYSELEPDTGYHNLKWCAMEEAKYALTMLPVVDAVPVTWLKKMRDDDRLTIDDVETIDLILAWWHQEQEEKDVKTD